MNETFTVNNNLKPAQERILGKWKFISVVTETIRPSVPVEVSTEEGAEGDYFDFRTDGNLYYSLHDNQKQVEPYSIENEIQGSKSITWSDEFKISSLKLRRIHKLQKTQITNK